MIENFFHGFGPDLEDAYDRVKWSKMVRSWKEVSDPSEKKEMLTIIK